MGNVKSKKVVKVIRIVLILVIILVIGFSINLMRKNFIIKELNNKIKDLSQEKNYYFKGENENVIMEYYKMNNKYLSKVETKDSEVPTSLTSYFTNEYVHKYYLTFDSKKYAIMEDGILDVPFEFPEMPKIKNDNKMNYISALVNIKISSETYNGKECYKITNLKNTENSESLTNEENDLIYNSVYYIEKETGLLIKGLKDTISNEYIEYIYEFNTVTEKDLEEPEVSEYEIVD